MKPEVTAKAVRSLTRLYFGRPKRPGKLSDRSRRHRIHTLHWGWQHNIVGIGPGPKITDSKMLSDVHCILIFVRAKCPLHRLHARERIPEALELDGIGELRTDVVEVGALPVGHVGVLVRPLRPGAQLGHVRGIPGTLGVLIRRSDGVILLGGCSHVLARSGRLASASDPIEQPFDTDGTAGPNTVAALEPGFSVLRPFGAGINLEDFAAARAGTASDPTILGTAIRVTEALDGTQISGGLRVRLFGSVDLGTPGTILAGPSAFRVDMPFAGLCDFAGVIPYRIASAPGDSGGAVVDEANPARLVGLHIAGARGGGVGLLLPIKASLDSRGYRLA